MKAILYRPICQDGEVYISPNAGWKINVLDDPEHSHVQYLIGELVKAGNEIQLIDYSIHMNNTYTVDTLLDETTLYMVERFYSLEQAKQAVAEADGEEYVSFNALAECSCGNPNCSLNGADFEW